MRLAIVVAVLFATGCFGADEAPTASRVLEGTKSTFPAKTMPDGVKKLTGVLESCHEVSDGTIPYGPDDLKKAQFGDYLRFVFTKPIKVDVRRKKVDATEVVYSNGVFWVVSGKEVLRCTKYTHEQWVPFQEWYRQSMPADGQSKD